MNVERVELSNFGSWRELDLALEPGVTLISGANGVGKSTILQAIEFALYGVASGAERLIRRGADEAIVAVEISTDAGELRVERAIRRSGSAAKVTLTLSQHVDGGLWPLSGATVGETQATLDDLLGVSRELLRSSAFSMQGDGAAFCEAAPRDRKRIFSTTLGLEFWDALAADAKSDATTASAQAQAARARLEQLDGTEERLLRAREEEFAAHERKKGATEDERNAESEVARLSRDAEAARETRRRHATATEAAQRARADHKRATAETAVAQESLERTRAAAAYAPDPIQAQADSAVAHMELEDAEADFRVASESRAHWNERYARVAEELRDLTAEQESGDCARCGQPLSGPVESKIAPLRAEYEQLLASRVEPDDTPVVAARARVHATATALAEARTIHALAGSIEAAEQRTLLAAARESDTSEIAYFADEAAIETAREVECIPADIEAGHATVTAALEQARVEHRQAAAALAAAEAAAKTAERDAADEQAARQHLAEAELEAAIAGILAAGFGPQGVPAMIVDGVLADLALEANRVLAELASPIRVDLRSQKLLKTSDRLADTLDIIALMDAQETPWERLSGGERTRVAIALRAALTRLLASKRGARVRLMVVDEPASLDAVGAEQLANVLEDFVRAGVFDTVLLIAHQHELAEQVERVVRIAKDPGGTSRLVDGVASASDAGDSAEPTRVAS